MRDLRLEQFKKDLTFYQNKRRELICDWCEKHPTEIHSRELDEDHIDILASLFVVYHKKISGFLKFYYPSLHNSLKNFPDYKASEQSRYTEEYEDTLGIPYSETYPLKQLYGYMMPTMERDACAKLLINDPEYDIEDLPKEFLPYLGKDPEITQII